MKKQTRRIVTTRTVPCGETVFFPDGTFNSTDEMLTIDTFWWTHDDWQEFFQTPVNERLSIAREIDRAHALINPANYEGAIPIIGVKCSIMYHDEVQSAPHPVYISFGTCDYDDQQVDSFGVDDDKVFFYLNKEEVESLTSAILNEENYWTTEDNPLNSEWYIDLTKGCTAITNKEEV